MVDPTRVRCYGPGLEPRGARAQQPAHFTVDASQAGDAPIQVIIHSYLITFLKNRK